MDDVAEPVLTTYADANGFFTVLHPSGWVVKGYSFEDTPFPHATFGTNQEIIDLSMANELLPEEQIGVGIMLMPRALFAEASIGPDTPTGYMTAV